MNEFIEIVAVIFNLTYLFLLMKEKIQCWYFGIVGSALSIYLFYTTGLFSEAILYIYYVAIGIYGFLFWKKNEFKKSLRVRKISIKQNIYWIILGIILAVGLGTIFKLNTKATTPYLDAFTTTFSFIASYLS
jgi:nicotinamide mononucleotide transporter